MINNVSHSNETENKMTEQVIRNCPKCLSTQERIKNLESMLDGKVKDHGDLCDIHLRPTNKIIINSL